MQCVVLAGGRATRMRPLTEHVPKAMLEVAGKPFAHHQLDLLARQGFETIVYCIGYRGDMIRESVGDGAAWGMRIEFSDERDDLRGTAGAIRLAADRGLLDEHFCILYGDSYLPFDPRPAWSRFRAGPDPALMTVLRNDGRWDTSNAAYESGRVTSYRKGSPDSAMHYIDYGLSMMTRDDLEQRVATGTVVDLAVLFEQLSDEGRLAGWEVRQRFYEIGSLQGLTDLEQFLERGAPAELLGPER